ncbi:MAG TPA: diguanylate cyclase, partial [Pseudomonadales bacterium]|nr:diguanylate cyclase [Pseudomonadales bacterium]
GFATYQYKIEILAAVKREYLYEAILRSLPLLVVLAAAGGVAWVNFSTGLNPQVTRIVVIGAGIGVILAMLRQSDLLYTHIDLLEAERLLRASDDEVRRSQQQLLQLNAMQQAILNGADYAIISTDTAGIIRSFNSAAVRMLGYEADELIGKTTPSIFHDANEVINRATELSAELGAKVEPGFEVFVLKSRSTAAEERKWTYIRKDGSRFPVRLSVTALRDDQGRIFGYLGIASDISERERIEQETAEQKDLLQAMMNASPGLFYMVGQDGRVKLWNKAFEQVLNYSPQDIASMQILDNCHPEDRLAAAKILKEIRETRQPRTLEARILTRDGRVIPILASGSSVMLNNELCVTIMAMDISARKVLEEDLQRFQHQLILRNENLKLIYQLSNRLHSLMDIGKIADATLATLRELARARSASFHLVEPDGTHLRMQALQGFGSDMLKALARIEMSGSASGWAIREGKVLVALEAQQETRIPAVGKNALVKHQLTSAVFIPLLFGDKKIGCVNAFFDAPEKLASLDSETLYAIGNTVSLAITNARHMEDLSHQAQHDALTNLPNRKVLHEVFSQLFSVGLSQNNTVALLLLDLDRFKEVNDTLGHHAGDLLLIQIGHRLTEILAQTPSLVCRLGGDEFAILLYGLTEREQALEYGRKISSALKLPFQIDVQNLQIGASIGIAYYPEHGKDSHALLRAADVAMYQAKRMGSEVTVYHRQIDAHSPERLAIISELGRAISESQLF